MNTSTYYNLKLVEGTDVVNPLTTDVPNYETIDEQMHNNSIAGVTLATEVASGKVHALIRENNECAVIRFIATSKWALGDTITVDGIPVVAVLPSGEALDEGAYVVNANVLCILSGTNLTVYAVGKNVENASDIKYNGTNVGAELDKLNGSVEQINGSVEQINNNLRALSNYSITETEIGTWVDGKQIYRRIYTADNVNISSASIIDSLFTSSNISTLIGIKCCTNISGEWNENLSILSDKTYSAYARVDAGGVRMVVVNSNVSKYAIIIEYTKP